MTKEAMLCPSIFFALFLDKRIHHRIFSSRKYLKEILSNRAHFKGRVSGFFYAV